METRLSAAHERGILAKGERMEVQSAETVALKDVMAQVGYLILFWSRLEVCISDEIKNIEDIIEENTKKSQKMASAKIKRWIKLSRDLTTSKDLSTEIERLGRELRDILSFRNAICHGLIVAIGNPLNGKASVTVSFEGQRRKIEFSELQEHVSKAELALHSVRHVSRAIAPGKRKGQDPLRRK